MSKSIRFLSPLQHLAAIGRAFLLENIHEYFRRQKSQKSSQNLCSSFSPYIADRLIGSVCPLFKIEDIQAQSLGMILKEMVRALADALGAQSVLCYGSYSQGLQDEKSDIDLLILADSIPSQDVREAAYRSIPQVQILSLSRKVVGDWDTSWTPVNDQIQVGSQIFEIGYNTTGWVDLIIHKLIVQHQISFEEFPFRPYTFLGLLESSQVLYDRDGFVAKCKSQIRPIPPELKRAIAQAFWPVLEENYRDLVDCAERNIGILAFEFFLFRGMDAAIQLLFVLNDVYDPASKRTEPFLFKLKHLPPHLNQFISEILPRFYEKKKEVCAFFIEMLQFLETREVGLWK